MSDLDAQIRAARVKRRTGYAFFGALTAYLTVPLLIGVISGVLSGEIWDPYTGEHRSDQESAARWCFDEASQLMQEAGRLDKHSRTWDQLAKQWTAKCRADQPDLHQVLLQTRSELRTRGKK